MATYFIGDVQGCFSEFQALLAKIKFNASQDTIYLAGDLIGRGLQSLQTLEFISQHPDCIRCVLGNHDLHFLAIANGIKRAKPSDRFDELLASPNLPNLINYLRQQPLLIHLPEFKLVLTHAGFSPLWSLDTAINAAQAVSDKLKQQDYANLLKQMYIGKNDHWPEAVTATDKLIFAINALTRIRYCYRDGRLDFNEKVAPIDCQNNKLIPWFKLPSQLPEDYLALFGHWASLMGQTHSSQFIGLDTGCLWGNHLTAWRLEDQTLTSVPSQN